jgi:hypothetical protein
VKCWFQHAATIPNDKLFNGYFSSLNHTASFAQRLTLTNFSPAQHTIIAYTLRDIAGAQAALWVNEDFANAPFCFRKTPPIG